MTDRRRRPARAAAVALFGLCWGLTAVIVVISVAKHQLASLDSGGSLQIALACVTVGTTVAWQRALQPASLSVWLRELGQRSELSSHLSVVTGVQAASLPSSRAGSSSVITSCR
jgi:hypothetical protein